MAESDVRRCMHMSTTESGNASDLPIVCWVGTKIEFGTCAEKLSEEQMSSRVDVRRRAQIVDVDEQQHRQLVVSPKSGQDLGNLRGYLAHRRIFFHVRILPRLTRSVRCTLYRHE